MPRYTTEETVDGYVILDTETGSQIHVDSDVLEDSDADALLHARNTLLSLWANGHSKVRLHWSLA